MERLFKVKSRANSFEKVFESCLISGVLLARSCAPEVVFILEH